MARHKTGRQFVPYIAELKAMGFVCEGDSHAGCCRTIQFAKEYPQSDRYVWVELSAWTPNQHFLMRLGRGNVTSLGRSSSLKEHGYPVEFSSVTEMLREIINQLAAR